MPIVKKDAKVTHTRTGIVGAGLAGIAASLNFLDNNYTDFLVYEALDRVGGRCNTIEYQESFLEIGAQVSNDFMTVLVALKCYFLFISIYMDK